jgi:hypothetical protein
MAVLREALVSDFKRRLREHIARILVQKGMPVSLPELQADIDAGLAQCSQFGMHRQCDIARLFEIVCTSLGGFNRGPLPKDVLNILWAYRVDPELKLRRLQEWTESHPQELC